MRDIRDRLEIYKERDQRQEIRDREIRDRKREITD